MWQDPIVAEIHHTREKIAQAYGNDIHAICEAARRGELSRPSAFQTPEVIQQGLLPAAVPQRTGSKTLG